MAEGALSHRLVMRGVYVVLVLAIIIIHLMPLDTHPKAWAPPDLILGFTFAWVLRRPDYVPLPVIAGVMLVVDLLFQRPPGLMAALVVLGSEYLRSRTQTRSEASFVSEWLAVGLTVATITVANDMILALMGTKQAQLSLSLMQAILTVVFYPLVVLLSQGLFGVRRTAPGDPSALGGRG